MNPESTNEAHNAVVVEDTTSPEATSVQVDTTVPPKVASLREFWLFLMSFAATRKKAADATAYRGRIPVRLGARAYARSQGFTDMAHMTRFNKAKARKEAMMAAARLNLPMASGSPALMAA